MKIDILCPEGSPLGIIPEDIWGRGVGGAELAMLTLAELLAKREHQVRVYNNPKAPGVHGNVEFGAVGSFDPSDSTRDAVILFRSPSDVFRRAKGKKVFWSCDQYTSGDYKQQVFPFADKVVMISERHKEFFHGYYGVNGDDQKFMVLPIGVRVWDYQMDPPPSKIPDRMIFCSVPDRGLDVMYKMWPAIKERIPNASLVITSDYRLWGFDQAGNHEHKLKWRSMPDVDFRGAVPRAELCRLQHEAEIQSYPNTYDELFCISVAECSRVGAVPVTSEVGALPTTNRFGVRIPGDPQSTTFQNQFVEALTKRELLDQHRQMAQTYAATEFNWDAIILLWEQLVLA